MKSLILTNFDRIIILKKWLYYRSVFLINFYSETTKI